MRVWGDLSRERSCHSVEADRCRLALARSRFDVLLLRRERNIYRRTIRGENYPTAGAQGCKFLVQHVCHFSKERVSNAASREATKHGQNADPEANLFGIKIERVALDSSFRNRIKA